MIVKLDALTWDSVVAVTLFLTAAIPTVWLWAKRNWGRFGLRWLEPNAAIDPDTDRPSRVIRLFPGKNVARFSLRPNVDISRVTRLSFSALENRRYPLRLWMGARGRFVTPPKIIATHIRRHRSGDHWDTWIAIPAPGPRERTAGWDCKIRFTSGSRQVFEVVYQVDEALVGWDGILGVEVSYAASSNEAHAYVNSKAFVGSGKRTPVTFRFRRVNSTQLMPPIPDTPASPPGVASRAYP